MNKLKIFRQIMDAGETDKVVILTNHYKITGSVYDCDDSSKDEFINLTDVKVCTEYYSVDSTSCDEYTSTYFDWLHINVDKIVAFSFIR